MISSNERQQIKALLQDPKWRVIENIAIEIQNRIKDESVLHSSTAKVLHSALLKEGRLMGINEFIKELYRQAQNVE